MTLVLFAGPTLEPLTVQEATEWARITESDDDDVVERLIRSARAHVETLTGRALITQTWDLYLDAFPCRIDVPRPPLQSVTYIKYTDANGAIQTLAPSEYTVDTKSEPGRIVPAYGKVWPSTRCEPNAVQVRFVAGFGADADAVDTKAPELRHAIGVLTGTLYEQREVSSDVAMLDVPEAFYQLVNQHRWF